ncbi:tetratricopeptide repeat protein [Pleurocapsales cyanobacterium LEGE 10410]|nr:tetratricopeptide repeat protein [Pleurocapsales cyanobacterium LEGE 10410]
MPTSKQNSSSSASKVTNSEKIMHVPGSIIGNRYQIIQKLGREEMSRTYLVKDLQATGYARCAVEQFSPNANEANWQTVIQHLIQETAVLERLGDHPQIPQFYNCFTENEQFYLVREYIDGDNLEQEVERKIFDEADVICLLQDALRILDFVHKTNVIHRNVQPIHLIRRKQDNAFVLINFGAIREIESTQINFQGELVVNNPWGNWSYVAPEQKTGESHFSSDLYALAKTAVYALTGRSPQELHHTNVIWREQCHISFKLESILNRMMSYRVEERYSSALEVLYDLRPLLKLKQVVGGRYLITRYLEGDGGIDTYVADNLHRQYQSPCLVKKIELPLTHGNSKVKIERRFAEELSILERLGYHAQIPQLWDHFEENDEFYLVQEYTQGESLAQKIARQDLSLAQIIQILESALLALSFIHQNRIIHRNIKPSNLIIHDETQQVILTNFGILSDIRTVPNATLDHSLSYDKQNYWSPEQIAGRPTMSSDLYSLGMTMVGALTQARPGALTRNEQTGDLLWAQDIALDRRLIRIIDKMIQLDLGKRYQSAERVFKDLQKINTSANSRVKQSAKFKSKITNRFVLPGMRLLPIGVGFLGLAFLLGSIEFAFPTVRPIYYWYRGQQLLPEKPQTALNIFTKANDLKPYWLAWSGTGDALYLLERYSEALEAYTEATELNPAEATAWQKQGDVLYRLEQFPEAIAAYDRALELEPNNGELYNLKGRALSQLQQYEAALGMQDAAVKIDRLNAQFLSDRAKNLQALGRYYQALTMLNRVQAIEPGNLTLWKDKASVLEALGRPQEAERVRRELYNNYTKILQNQPQNAQIWLSQGDLFADTQMYQKAIDSYERAIELKPKLYEVWLAKGKVLAQLGQDQAIDALNTALQIRPRSYLALQAKASFYQNSQNNLVEAIANYDRAIEIAPYYASLWRDRGLALSQQGKYDQAVESLTQASKIAPQDDETWVGLATVWDLRGQDRKALAAIDRALEINPRNSQSWSFKGSIYTKNGQYNQACETYRQSRLVIPDSSEITNSMRALRCRMN